MSMHPPPDPDELASDLVDGLLPAGEAARLRRDPAIAARVEAIEAARAALRVPPPPSPGAVDRAVAATFAALDGATLPMPGLATGGAEGAGEWPPPPVTHLRPRPATGAPAGSGGWAPAGPSRGARRSGSMPWLTAAAAVVVLGLVTIGLLAAGSDPSDQSSSDQAAESGAPAERESGGSGGSGDAGTGEGADGDDTLSAGEEGAVTHSGDEAPADQPTAGGSATTAATPEVPSPTGGDLGAVDTPAQLADRIRARSAQPGAASGDAVIESDTEDAGQGCAGFRPGGDPARGDAVYSASAVYAGEPVQVHVYDTGGGELRLVATNAACVDVVDTPYGG